MKMINVEEWQNIIPHGQRRFDVYIGGITGTSFSWNEDEYRGFLFECLRLAESEFDIPLLTREITGANNA